MSIRFRHVLVLLLIALLVAPVDAQRRRRNRGGGGGGGFGGGGGRRLTRPVSTWDTARTGVAKAPKFAPPPPAAAVSLQSAYSTFDRHDRSGDKSMSRAEAARAGIVVTFSTYDLDGNDQISREEFIVGLNDALVRRQKKIAPDLAKAARQFKTVLDAEVTREKRIEVANRPPRAGKKGKRLAEELRAERLTSAREAVDRPPLAGVLAGKSPPRPVEGSAPRSGRTGAARPASAPAGDGAAKPAGTGPAPKPPGPKKGAGKKAGGKKAGGGKKPGAQAGAGKKPAPGGGKKPE